MKRGVVVWETTIGGLSIELIQYSPEHFAVEYWKQRKGGLSYKDVAKELGESILHTLTCAGELDERGNT